MVDQKIATTSMTPRNDDVKATATATATATITSSAAHHTGESPDVAPNFEGDDGTDTEINRSNGAVADTSTSTQLRADNHRYPPTWRTVPGAYVILGRYGWGYRTPADSRGQDAEMGPRDSSCDVVATAYTVEESPEPVSAEAVETCFGVERKRLVALCMGVFLVMFIVLAIVLGILIPKANSNDAARETQNVVCGPLCGADNSPVPNSDRVILGLSCSDWDANSRTLPLSSGSESIDECSRKYSAAAFGCGCANAEVSANNACGKLCADGSDLPNPDMMVKDITNTEMSCADWELKAKFDSNSRECVNYNVIGIMCGCKNNEPHPDACGPLCTGDSFAPEDFYVYGTTCKNWNIMSTSLPKWYHNEEGEKCSDYYRDIAYACGCKDVKRPHDSCNTLCQDRRICGQICQDGSSVPDDNLIVRTTTCHSWEYHSRIEVHDDVCPFYDMIGSECGCNNSPPEDACGPLCGPQFPVPDPDLIVQGLTCSEWDSASKFLTEVYTGHADACNTHYSRPALACGCPGVSLPSNGCGGLCADGSPLPDPSLVVGSKRCADWELLSMFETDPLECSRYRLFGPECGCEDPLSSSIISCFTVDSITNKTFSHTVGFQQFVLTFGEGGVFGVMQSNIAMNVIGRYNGFGVGEDENVASFGGGSECGTFGIRRGSVTIVEDPLIVEPKISYVIEPTVCVYKAELRVPAFCSATGGDALL